MVGPSRRRYICHGLIVAAALATKPAFGANPDNGERLAHRWCEPAMSLSFQLVSAARRPIRRRRSRVLQRHQASMPPRSHCSCSIRIRRCRIWAYSQGSGGSCGLYCNAQIVRPRTLPPRSGLVQSRFSALNYPKSLPPIVADGKNLPAALGYLCSDFQTKFRIRDSLISRMRE